MSERFAFFLAFSFTFYWLACGIYAVTQVPVPKDTPKWFTVAIRVISAGAIIPLAAYIHFVVKRRKNGQAKR